MNNDDREAHEDTLVDDSNEEGSEYSDTEDRKARKRERKAMLGKRARLKTSPKK